MTIKDQLSETLKEYGISDKDYTLHDLFGDDEIVLRCFCDFADKIRTEVSIMGPFALLEAKTHAAIEDQSFVLGYKIAVDCMRKRLNK